MNVRNVFQALTERLLARIHNFRKEEKFVFNPHTLSYDRVAVSARGKAIRGFAIASGVIVIGAAGAIFARGLFPTAHDHELEQQIGAMKFQNDLVLERVKDMEGMLDKVHRRDNQLYRTIFGAAPVDETMWTAGRGGSEKYANLQGLPNRELLQATVSKLDKLQSQVILQSKSFEEVTTLVKNKEQMLASIPSIRPVKEITDLEALSGFGMRIHPIHKIAKMHKGIDFTAPTGTKIYATGNGTVSLAQQDGSGYGKHVIIDHGFGYKTLYGHMSEMKVTLGQKVKRGELIGLVGSTGSSTGPHCHYEVLINDDNVNPINYCQDDLTPEEYKKLSESALRPMQSFD